MTGSVPTTAILHYSAPPVIGGVEAVILAHAETFVAYGYPVTVIAGRGEADALPEGVDLVRIPELDSQHGQVLEMGRELEQGIIPLQFEGFVDLLARQLAPIMDRFDNVIVHNVFTKRFNLPLTAALFRLMDANQSTHYIAWCHDFDWTSSRSRAKVHPGYPWDLLRGHREDVTYVVVSQQRQKILAELLGCPREDIQVIYNGVSAPTLLGLTETGHALVERLELFSAELIMLMPVRVTQAKNIEYALRVVAALKARGCQVKLVLTGPPDPHDEGSMGYFHSLQELRRQLGVEQEMRFVFESGPDPDEGYIIGYPVVADLYRVSDLLFMPSHREGFGMPVLEAGLCGMPVVSTPVPAAEEIGGEDVLLFDRSDDPQELADRILDWSQSRPVHRLRQRVRQNYTWQTIFQRRIEPMLQRSQA
ncbi:MAG: glycosyltransferase family 4 protein [Anaerolineae bacterium]